MLLSLHSLTLNVFSYERNIVTMITSSQPTEITIMAVLTYFALLFTMFHGHNYIALIINYCKNDEITSPNSLFLLMVGVVATIFCAANFGWKFF